MRQQPLKVKFNTTVGSPSGTVALGHLNSITLTTPDTDFFTINASNNTGATLSDGSINKSFGARTTAHELVALINEIYPANTAGFTSPDSAKSLTSDGGTKNISDFFYATVK